MTAVLDVAIAVLAGVCLLAALFFIASGLRARSNIPEHAYGVERQEARHGMLVAFSRGFALLIVGLILIGIFGLGLRPGGSDSVGAPTNTVAPTQAATSSLTSTAVVPDATTAVPSAPATPTSPVLPPTSPATSTSEATGTAAVPTAVVDSPNGLWLREAPGGTRELELVAHGTELTLLAGRETAEELEWQQVRTPAGNEGWVAADFLIYR